MDINTLGTVEEKLAYEAGREDGIEYVKDLALKHCNHIGDPYLLDTLTRLLDDDKDYGLDGESGHPETWRD